MRYILKGVSAVDIELAVEQICRITKAHRDGLRPERVPVRGKTKTYYAIRYKRDDTRLKQGMTPSEIERYSEEWVKKNVELPRLKDFTPSEVAAIINYKTPLHEAINNFLDYGEEFSEYPEPDMRVRFYDQETDSIKETVLHETVMGGMVQPLIVSLDAAISKGFLKRTATVYRGIIVEKNVVEFWQKIKGTGVALYSNRFTSTTLVREGAERWTASQVNRKRFREKQVVRVLIEGSLPAGSRLLDYPVTGKAIVGSKLDSMKLGPGKGGVDNEAELLLPRKLEFTVDEVELLRDGQYHVKINFVKGA